MPLYELTRNDGATITIEGPEGATKEDLIGIYNNEAIALQEEQDSEIIRERAQQQELNLLEDMARSQGMDLVDYLQEIPKSLLSGASGFVEQALIGAADIVLPEGVDDSARELIKEGGQYIQDAVAPHWDAEGTLPRQFGEAVGSFAGIVGLSAINPALGIGAAGAAGAGEAGERARDAGATDEQESEAIFYGTLVGFTEVLPAQRFAKLLTGKELKEASTALRRIASEAGFEGAQEAAAGYAQNLIEQSVYNEDKDVIEGVAEQGGMGASVGAFAKALLEFALPRSRRGGVSEQAGLEGEPEAPAGETVEEAVSEDTSGIAGLLPPPKQEPLIGTPTGEVGTQEQLDSVVGDMPSPEVRSKYEEQQQKIAEEGGMAERTAAVEAIQQAEEAKRTADAQAEADAIQAEIDSTLTDTDRTNIDKAVGKINDGKTVGDLTVGEIVSVAKAEGIKIPVKSTKARALEILGATGVDEVSIGTTRPAISTTEEAKVEQPATSGLDISKAKVAGSSPEFLELNKAEQEALDKYNEVKERWRDDSENPELTIELNNAEIEATKAEINTLKYQKKKPGADVKEADKRIRQKQKAIKGLEEDIDNLRSATPTETTQQPTQQELFAPTETVANPVTKDFLDTLGINPRAAIRKRIEGKDVNDANVQQDLAKYAKLKTTPKNVSDNISGALTQTTGGTDAGVLTGDNRVADQGAVGESVPSGEQRVGREQPPTGTSTTTKRPATPRRGRLDEGKRGAARIAGGARAKHDTLAKKYGKVFTDAVPTEKDWKVLTPQGKKEVIKKVLAKAPAPAKETTKGKKVTRKAPATLKAAPTPPGRVKAKTTTRKPVTTKEPTELKKEPRVNREDTIGKTVATGPRRTEGRSKEALTRDRKLAKEIRDTWEKKAKLPIKNFVLNMTTGGFAEVATDPSTAGDKTAVLDVLKSNVRDDVNAKAAKIYLLKMPRTIDSLSMLAYDIGFSTKKYRKSNIDPESVYEAEFLKGTGGENAQNAYKWVQENLSEETNAWMKAKIAKYNASASHITDYIREDKVEVKRAEEEALIKLLEDDARKEAERERARKLREAASPDIIESEIFELPIDAAAVAALDTPLHPLGRQLLLQGDLAAALRVIASTSTNERVSQIASKLAENVGDTKVKVKSILSNDAGKPVAGLFNPEKNTISLDEELGLNPHVIMHEMVHAVTSATLAKKGHPVTKQLQKIFNSVKDELSTAYGSQSLDEFVSEAMSNPRFAQELASIFAKNADVPVWRQFINTVANLVRNLVGLPQRTLTSSLTEVDGLVQSIIAPAPEYRFAGELAMAVKEGTMGSVLSRLGKAYYEGGRAQSKVPLTEYLDKAVEFLSTAKKETKQFGLYVSPSQALGDIMRRYGVKGAMDLHEMFETQEGDMSTGDQILDATIEKVTDWQKTVDQDTIDTFNKVIHTSTVEQVDPTEPRSKYLNDPEKLQAWDAMQASIKAIGPTGVKQYQRLRDTYKELYKKLRVVLDSRIEELVPDERARKTLKSKVFEELFDSTNIEPYFPLTRQGDYWLSYNVGGEFVVEAFETDSARTRVMRELELDTNVTGISPYSNIDSINYKNAPPTSFVGETLRALENTGAPKEARDAVLKLFIEALPETSFAKSMQKRKNTLGYNEDAVNAFRLKAYDISRQAVRIKNREKMRAKLAETLEEIRLRTQQSQDIQYALDAAEASGDAQAIKKAQEAKDAFIKETDAQPLTEENANLFKNELEQRVEFATNPPADMWQRATRAANRLAFLGTLGFNLSSSVVNTSQIPLVVAPFMAGKTSIRTAGKVIKAASAFWGGSGIKHVTPVYGKDGEVEKVNTYVPSIDNYYVADTNGNLRVRDDLELDNSKPYYTFKKKDGTERSFTQKQFVDFMLPLVQKAGDRGLLNRSLFYDTLGAEMGGKKKTISDRISAISAFPFHTTERMNRQVSLVGNYLNEIERIMTNPNPRKGEDKLGDDAIFENALETALYDTQQTNGGAVLSTAPRIAQKYIGRVAMMYKTYGVQMYYTQLKTALQMLKKFEKDPYMRKQARRQTAAVFVSVLAMSGVQGLTIYGIAAAIANMFLDDDEETAETITRKFFGEGMYKGGINYLTGLAGMEVDVASRVGLSNLILGNNRYNFDPSMEKSIVQMFGGPFYGYGSQIIRGVEDMLNGEIQRGVENVLPAAFRNVAKTIRYNQEGGIRTRRGDLVLSDSDLNAGLYIAQMMGFAPAEYTRKQEINQDIKKIDRAVSEKRTNLLRKYYVAMRFYDYDSMRKIQREISKYNRRHPTNRISRDSIKRSMKKHRETSQKMYNGVTLSPKMRDVLRQEASEYDRGPQFWD